MPQDPVLAEIQAIDADDDLIIAALNASATALTQANATIAALQAAGNTISPAAQTALDGLKAKTDAAVAAIQAVSPASAPAASAPATTPASSAPADPATPATPPASGS